MPPPKYPTRAQQPSTAGLGKQFKSPTKRQNKAKTTTHVQYFGRKEEILRLQAKLDLLKRQAENHAAGIADPPIPDAPKDNDIATPRTNAVNEIVNDNSLPGPECIETTQEECTPRRMLPNQAVKDLYSNWTNLLERLVTPSIEYSSKGGDLQVCIDGNFNHWHMQSAGDSPHFYDPTYILPKEYVDAVGKQMDQLWKMHKPHHHNPVVPDEAINECKSLHTASNGSNIKTNMERFDDSSLMAFVCHHDILILLTNINSPGEQQKYAIAMLEYLFTLLPPQATMAALYDVGCVLN
ncbi:hypothetical protein C0989_002947 [Termitomyces sp. Mn162]|nr:hypothetical protein C0989_002947 [Termitomyces sp. Mn162]